MQMLLISSGDAPQIGISDTAGTYKWQESPRTCYLDSTLPQEPFSTAHVLTWGLGNALRPRQTRLSSGMRLSAEPQPQGQDPWGHCVSQDASKVPA